MTLGAWRRHDAPPTAAAMADGISDPRRPMWIELTRWLRETYGLEGELTWTDEETGWVLRYRRNGKALTTLMPGEAGGIGALVVVGPSIVDAALAAPLSEPTREALEVAKPYADGRWLWLKVTEPRIVEDIETLIRLKSPPPRRPRSGAVDAAAEELEREPASPG
ncbi:MAG: hypothetical protein A2V85_14210 [Chloroflexi bacterium RBG_16_72_14]|nr:MAG: hypothetical protein A2V85_14210 [Chloroflexi bacterium RBG_16_72_14]